MGTKKITVTHKRNDCIGCARCFYAAPHTWEMSSDDGQADLKEGRWKNENFVVAQVDEDLIEDNRRAADSCPVGVIKIPGYND